MRSHPVGRLETVCRTVPAPWLATWTGDPRPAPVGLCSGSPAAAPRAPRADRSRRAEEITNPENRGYADNGSPAFREAAARFMQREYNVALDPPTEIVPCIGSKNALAMLPACFINPGDITLMTVPGYPVAGTHTKYYGGSVYRMPLTAEKDFLPDFASIPDIV